MHSHRKILPECELFFWDINVQEMRIRSLISSVLLDMLIVDNFDFIDGIRLWLI
jgi:hypothetical protein